MNAVLPIRLTVDEFLRWSMDQECGRYELEEGRIVVMPSETIGHTDTKLRVYLAVASAVQRSGMHFYAMPDGPTVRAPGVRAYEPDALIAPLPKPSPRCLEINDPIVVFEVLSPSPESVRRDLTTKLRGYALVPTIEHYVVVDPEARCVFRFSRRGDALAAMEELATGDVLRLDPPGLEMPVADLVLPPEASEAG